MSAMYKDIFNTFSLIVQITHHFHLHSDKLYVAAAKCGYEVLR